MCNQEDQILNHLKTVGPITPIEALNFFGCFRLGARCYDLRQKGYDIETEIVHQNGKHFARYRLKVEEVQIPLREIPCGKQNQLSFA